MPSNHYFNEDFYASEKIPIGTGRFKVTDISSNSITLARNIKWKAKNENEQDDQEGIMSKLLSIELSKIQLAYS